jgi:hypothetical protein
VVRKIIAKKMEVPLYLHFFAYGPKFGYSNPTICNNFTNFERKIRNFNAHLIEYNKIKNIQLVQKHIK